jgi:hypothetical protein
MLDWFKDFLYNKASFEQYCRVALFMVGEMGSAFAPNSTLWWVSKAVQAMAVFPSNRTVYPPVA